jgi:hypothetical protein
MLASGVTPSACKQSLSAAAAAAAAEREPPAKGAQQQQQQQPLGHTPGVVYPLDGAATSLCQQAGVTALLLLQQKQKMRQVITSQHLLL